LEIRGVPGLKDSDNVGYVTFGMYYVYIVLFPRHFQGAAGPEAISKIYLFRDYFHYHIKASKAYMHSRMRARVDSFLKVLNRAKPEVPGEQKTAR
jgi:actin related protein 2/3 complex subunit 2